MMLPFQMTSNGFSTQTVCLRNSQLRTTFIKLFYRAMAWQNASLWVVFRRDKHVVQASMFHSTMCLMFTSPKFHDHNTAHETSISTPLRNPIMRGSQCGGTILSGSVLYLLSVGFCCNHIAGLASFFFFICQGGSCLTTIYQMHDFEIKENL